MEIGWRDNHLPAFNDAFHTNSPASLPKGEIILSEKQKHHLEQLVLLRRGTHHSEESKQKIRLSHEGKSLSEETKRKISETEKRLYKEGKIIHPRGMLGKHQSEETMKKISKNPNYGMRGKHHTKESKEKNRLAHLGKKLPEETKKKWSKFRKLEWQNPEIRENRIKAILKGLFKRPTSLEMQMIEIIQRNNLPYRYTGDGSFLIGYKNPDFVNINGEKDCIEVRHTLVCKYMAKETFDQYRQQRTAHYSKYGWNCIVLSENDLEDEKRLLEVLNYNQRGI